MTPTGRYYLSWTILVTLLVALIAAIVRLVRDERMASARAKRKAETLAIEQEKKTQTTFIQQREGVVRVSVRLDDGRLVNLESFADKPAAAAFIVAHGSERLQQRAAQLAVTLPARRPKSSKKPSKKRLKLMARMQADFELEKLQILGPL